MALSLNHLIRYEWWALLMVWVLLAFTVKHRLQTQPISSRLPYILIMLLAAWLVFGSNLSIPFLPWQFLPNTSAVKYIGLTLTSAGIGFAIWARLFLGRNWSATPSIVENHQLIRSGPYRFVRHPIYSGVLLALFGTTIFEGRVAAILGTLIAAISFHVKSRAEEHYMTQQFGTEYLRYQREVKALIPFLL